MMTQLPAFLSATMGNALLWELALLVVFILFLNIRRMLWRALAQRAAIEPAELRRELWRLLRSQS